jgi:hypothetical protein
MLSMVGSSGCLARSTRSSSELGISTPRRLVTEVLKVNGAKDVATAKNGPGIVLRDRDFKATFQIMTSCHDSLMVSNPCSFFLLEALWLVQ